MKKNNFFAFSLLVFLLASCATSPVVNKFMNPELSAKDHALLIIDNNIGVGMVDGEFTFGSSGAGTDGTLRSRTPMILLMPGRHTLMVQYIRQTSDSRTITTTTSDLIPVTGNFLAGHIYRLQPSVNGNTVSFAFNEDADTSIWNTEDLASVKPPKKVLFSSIISSAATEPATQLEGTWIVKEVPPEFAQRGATAVEITFTGKSYLVKMTVTFNATQLEQQNEIRKGLGQSTLVSTIAYQGQRGTFETNGNTLTLGALQITLDNDLDNAVWINSSQKLDLQFDYSVASDGSLMLSFEKGNQLLNYLGKNPILTRRE
jgi:hypothetical protein